MGRRVRVSEEQVVCIRFLTKKSSDKLNSYIATSSSKLSLTPDTTIASWCALSSL